MILNSETGRKAQRKPGLDFYDNKRPAAVIQVSADAPTEYKAGLVLEKEYPSTHTRDKALLVALGVNGEVPLDQAMATAGLWPSGGVVNGRGKQTAWFATRAANDSEQRRVAA